MQAAVSFKTLLWWLPAEAAAAQDGLVRVPGHDHCHSLGFTFRVLAAYLYCLPVSLCFLVDGTDSASSIALRISQASLTLSLLLIAAFTFLPFQLLQCSG